MKITQITNASFGAKQVRIPLEGNERIPHLYREIMKATSVDSEHRSGQVVYRIGGKDAGIEISQPAESLHAFLKKMGIDYTFTA